MGLLDRNSLRRGPESQTTYHAAAGASPGLTHSGRRNTREQRATRRAHTFGPAVRQPDAKRAAAASMDWVMAVAADLPAGDATALRREVATALADIARKYDGA